MEDVGVTLCAALDVELVGVDGRAHADLVPDRRGPRAGTPGEVGAEPGRASARPARGGLAPPLERTVTRLAAEHRSTRQLADHLDVRTRQLDHRANLSAAALDAHELRLRQLEREASVRTVTDWVRAAVVPETMVVSVIIPTRDRASIVPAAIESALGQTYGRTEVVVVDDGSVDETPEVLAKFDDERLHVVRGDGDGVCAARNRGLEVANGEVVVYLDDDNTMMPWWCKAVVWGFAQRPDADVLYGARVIDDIVRARHEGEGAMPSVQFEPYDFEVLTHHNFTDMNVIAHRAGLAEARFDESVATYGDWDLFWRLTRFAPPLELPVLACHYSTEGDGRLSLRPDDLEHRDAVRAKFARLLAEG
jgi:hypothetical protein